MNNADKLLLLKMLFFATKFQGFSREIPEIFPNCEKNSQYDIKRIQKGNFSQKRSFNKVGGWEICWWYLGVLFPMQLRTW